MIDRELASATTIATAKSGYVYNLVLYGGGVTYCIGNAPVNANTGGRSFSTDTPGIVYVHAPTYAAPPTSTAGGRPLGLN